MLCTGCTSEDGAALLDAQWQEALVAGVGRALPGCTSEDHRWALQSECRLVRVQLGDDDPVLFLMTAGFFVLMAGVSYATVASSVALALPDCMHRQQTCM